jgi:phosphotransferase system IIB component
MPHEAHVQTVELKTILLEKEVLENELQNTKAIVGTFKDQKEVLESQGKLLKHHVDQLSLSDPNFSLCYRARGVIS